MSLVFDECGEVIRRLDDYLDRELSAGEIEEVRAHLRACAGCADEFRFEAAWIRSLREKARRIEFSGALAGRIRDALDRAAT